MASQQLLSLRNYIPNDNSNHKNNSCNQDYQDDNIIKMTAKKILAAHVAELQGAREERGNACEERRNELEQRRNQLEVLRQEHRNERKYYLYKRGYTLKSS